MTPSRTTTRTTYLPHTTRTTTRTTCVTRTPHSTRLTRIRETGGIILRLPAVCALLTLTLISCAFQPASTIWSKPGAPPDEFERVNEQCDADIGMAGLKGASGYDVCMHRHGWMLIQDRP